MNAKLKIFLSIPILIITLNFAGVKTSKAALEPGVPLPVFKLTSLDGQEIALQDYLGKIVIIHLWKCQWNQCRAEIPHLLKVQEKYNPEKVIILSINVLNKKGRVEAEVEKYKMNYTVLVGRGKNLTSDYEIKKLPHLFILDRRGIIHTSERFMKDEEIMKALDELLQEEEKTELEGNN